MKQNVFTVVLLSAVVFLHSCGTSKKLETAQGQINQLNSQVTALNASIAEKDKQIAELQRANEINSRDAADCRAAKEVLRKKRENLDRELAARGMTFDQLIEKEEAAVRKFKEAGCEVNYKNGRYHVIVPDEFVFKTGSAKVESKGRLALNVVAEVMYDNPGVTTTIVGNTDSIPVRGDADNWSLSTERANAVVRVLEYVYNINPKRLVAAGRSKFNPVASNATPEGQARNRRIEIIINPHYDRLFDLLED